LKGGSYMLPFRNHILANFGVFILVRSWILWYVCCMYLGTKGWFFLTCVFLWSPSVPLRFVGNLPLLSHMCTYSNTPLLKFRFLRLSICACVLVVASSPHHHRPSAITTGRIATWLHISVVPQTFIAASTTRHWTSNMAKKPPPSESATHPVMADSHVDLSSLISGTSFDNVDALTISPTAWTTSHSSMAQPPTDEVHKDTNSAKSQPPVPKCVGPTRDPTASAESSVSLAVLSCRNHLSPSAWDQLAILLHQLSPV